VDTFPKQPTGIKPEQESIWTGSTGSTGFNSSRGFRHNKSHREHRDLTQHPLGATCFFKAVIYKLISWRFAKSITPQKQPSEDAIVVENVSKRFLIPKEKRRTVLENLTGILRNNSYEEFSALKTISFRVKKGETLGIIGENGSGKSTLLKIIAGVLQPDTGTVKVVGKIAPFLELGVGFQPELTALENVSLYCSIMGMNHKMIVEKLDGIFEFAELERFREMKLKNFSSGMRHSREVFRVKGNVIY
jgi:ABC-type glutathione transport system ATPase component